MSVRRKRLPGVSDAGLRDVGRSAGRRFSLTIAFNLHVVLAKSCILARYSLYGVNLDFFSYRTDPTRSTYSG